MDHLLTYLNINKEINAIFKDIQPVKREDFITVEVLLRLTNTDELTCLSFTTTRYDFRTDLVDALNKKSKLSYDGINFHGKIENKILSTSSFINREMNLDLMVFEKGSFNLFQAIIPTVEHEFDLIYIKKYYQKEKAVEAEMLLRESIKIANEKAIEIISTSYGIKANLVHLLFNRKEKNKESRYLKLTDSSLRREGDSFIDEEKIENFVHSLKRYNIIVKDYIEAIS